MAKEKEYRMGKRFVWDDDFLEHIEVLPPRAPSPRIVPPPAEPAPPSGVVDEEAET